MGHHLNRNRLSRCILTAKERQEQLLVGPRFALPALPLAFQIGLSENNKHYSMQEDLQAAKVVHDMQKPDEAGKVRVTDIETCGSS